MEAWRQELYLQHHGILGQKWGKRNGPPYPLGASDHSASEKKAGWRKSLDSGSTAVYTKKHKMANRVERSKAKTESELKDGAKPDFDKEKAKRIARNVAIGAAVVGVALGSAYGYKSYKQSKHLKSINKDIQDYIREHASGPNATRLSVKLQTTPIDQLPDKDFVIKGGTTFQRIIRVKNSKSGIAAEKLKDVMYAVYEENDKNNYMRMYGSREARQKGVNPYAMSFTTNKDLKSPSERRRLQVFMDLMDHDDEFYYAFMSDSNSKTRFISRGFKTYTPHRTSSWLNDSSQQDYIEFHQLLGDITSESRKIYFKRLKELGYNALIDDNDALAWGHMPVILLDATNDAVINGAKKITKAMTYAAAIAVSKEDLVKPHQ